MRGRTAGEQAGLVRDFSFFQCGIHLEDQVLPKRCGHLAGKAVIPAADMAAKIAAARAARSDPAFLLIARTDAIAVTGLDDAIERACRYADAGADALFLDAPESMAQLGRIGATLGSLGKPLVFNAASTGKTPALAASQCRALGFGLVLYPIEAMLAALDGARAVMRAVRDHGDLAPVRARMASFDDVRTLLGFARAEAFEAAHPVGRQP